MFLENIEYIFQLMHMQVSKGKGKGKAIPLQALRVPECSSGLRLPDFKTIGT
jgi:hypothetical protein